MGFQVKYLIQQRGKHDAEARIPVNICLIHQVDVQWIFFSFSFLFFPQITGSVSRNCTSGGWSRPFPPYHVACSVVDDIPEVKAGSGVIVLKGQTEEGGAAGGGRGRGQWNSGKAEREK